MFVWAIFSGGVLLICLLKADEAMGFCMRGRGKFWARWCWRLEMLAWKFWMFTVYFWGSSGFCYSAMMWSWKLGGDFKYFCFIFSSLFGEDSHLYLFVSIRQFLSSNHPLGGQWQLVGHGGTLFLFFNNSQTLHRKTKLPKGRKIMFHSFTFRYSICITCTCIYYTHIAMHRHSVIIYIHT